MEVAGPYRSHQPLDDLAGVVVGAVDVERLALRPACRHSSRFGGSVGASQQMRGLGVDRVGREAKGSSVLQARRDDLYRTYMGTRRNSAI